MQPVAPQDRPKVIAVVIGIVIALGFVAHSVMGMRTMAAPQAEVVASPSASSEADHADRATATEARTSLASTDDRGSGERSLNPSERSLLHDPFFPLGKCAITPAPAAPAPVVVKPTAVAPEPVAAPNSICPTAAPVKSAHPDVASPVTLGDARLVGTVRQEPTAVAVFRTSETTLFVRPAETIASWRVVRVDDGQVSLSRRNKRQLMRVGEILPGDR